MSLQGAQRLPIMLRSVRRRPWLAGLAALPILLAGDAAEETPAHAAGWIEELILDAGWRRGLDVQRMLRVAWRESRYQPGATGPWIWIRGYGWDRGQGVFQFIQSTWRSVAPLAGYGDWSPYDPVANVETAAFVMSRRDLGGWNHWRATDW